MTARALAAAAALAFAPGCRAATPPAPAGPVADGGAAEARFRAFYAGSLAPALAEADRRRADALLAGAARAESLPCREAGARLAEAGVRALLHGTAAALARDGACYLLVWDGRLRAGLGAAVAKDGAVLAAWWIPEG